MVITVPADGLAPISAMGARPSGGMMLITIPVLVIILSKFVYTDHMS